MQKLESKFYVDLQIKKLGSERFEVLASFPYQSQRLGTIVYVPPGFITDFASVPRLPLIYWMTGNTAQEAAVVHDYLYQKHGYLLGDKWVDVSRRQADLVFYEAMGAMSEPEPLWRREMMYLGVRLGGRVPYKTGPQRYEVLQA